MKDGGQRSVRGYQVGEGAAASVLVSHAEQVGYRRSGATDGVEVSAAGR